MATIRQAPGPEDHYTMVPNAIARSSLTPKAKAVYLYLRSHREGWTITTERVGKEIGMSRETVGKAVQELMDSGYIIRKQKHREGGLFGDAEYTVLSYPTDVEKSDNGQSTVVDFTDDGSTDDGFSDNIRRPIPKKTNLQEDQPPVGPPEGDAPTDDPGTQQQSGSSSSRKKQKRRLTDDWTPKPGLMEELAAECPTIDQDHQLNLFRDHYIAKDQTSTDWNRNYRNWIRREAKWQKQRNTPSQRPSKFDQIMQAGQSLHTTDQKEITW